MANLPGDIARILGPNEAVMLYLQQKFYHPKISIDSVILTNQRIILRHPHEMNLRKDFTDFSYTDVANAVLDKGIMRSTVKCELRFGGDPLMLSDLPNGDAEKAYGIIRSNIARYQTPFTAGGPYPAYPVAMQGVPSQAQMPGVRCGKCGQTNPAGTRFCGSCGQQIQQ